MIYKPFENIFEIPLRNGLTKPKSVRGDGFKMVNMGELFRYPRIKNISMDRVPLSEAEKNSSILKVGDLLFARQSLVLEGAGQCSIFLEDKEQVCFESHLIRCRLNKKIASPLFYYYYFLSRTGKMAINSIVEQGAGAAGIRGSDLAKVLVPDVNIDYQNKVAEIFDQIDSKIELSCQTNQTLEQIAQAIFKSWFVDFEPVKAKMAAKQAGASAEQIEQAAICAISGKTPEQLAQLDPQALQQLKATAALFPDALVDSELGEIPEGWDIKPLAEIAENHSTTFDFSKVDEVVFVNTGDVLEGRFLHKNYLNKVGLPGQAKKAIKKNDILYSEIRPKNKRFAYVTKDCDDYVVSTKFMVIRSLGFVHPRYLYQILRQDTTIQEFNLIAESRSGTFPQITFDSIGYMPVVVPCIPIQESFMAFFNRLIEKMDLAVSEEKSLAMLRDELLPKLLSGELSIASSQSCSEQVL